MPIGLPVFAWTCSIPFSRYRSVIINQWSYVSDADVAYEPRNIEEVSWYLVAGLPAACRAALVQH